MSKQKSSNSGAFRAFVLTLVILILAVCVMAAMTEGFTNWNPYGWFDEQQPSDEQQPDADNPAEESAPIDATITNSEHVMLAMSMATTAAEDGYTKSVTLTATVMPEDAPDKSVDWSIAWNEAPTYGDNPVTDYVTVTPQSDGSNVATVTCLQPFGTDTIIITCTTRVDGYTATARVSYAGLPTEIAVDTMSMSSIIDGWDVPIYQATCGSTYTLPIVTNNEFGTVGEDFVPQYSISVSAIGQVAYKTRATTYSRNGSVISSTHTDKTINYGDDVIGAEAYGSKNFGSAFEATIKVELSGTNIIVTPLQPLSALLYVDSQTSTYYLRHTDFTAADPDKSPYVQITIKEETTGISAVFNVRVMATVVGVSLDSSSIVF